MSRHGRELMALGRRTYASGYWRCMASYPEPKRTGEFESASKSSRRSMYTEENGTQALAASIEDLRRDVNRFMDEIKDKMRKDNEELNDKMRKDNEELNDKMRKDNADLRDKMREDKADLRLVETQVDRIYTGGSVLATFVSACLLGWGLYVITS